MSGTIDTKKTTPILGSDLPGGGRVEESKGKATPKGPSFGNVLAAASPLVKGAESAASVLPGGPIVAAALKGTSNVGGMTPYSSAIPGGVGSVGGSAGGVGISTSAGTSATTAGTTIGALDGGTGVAADGDAQSVIANSEAFNLYYLQLQEEMSAENRSYTALSNVLKARHDTVKNAIGNIR